MVEVLELLKRNFVRSRLLQYVVATVLKSMMSDTFMDKVDWLSVWNDIHLLLLYRLMMLNPLHHLMNDKKVSPDQKMTTSYQLMC